MKDDFTFKISRVFDAPLGLVWKAWTDKSMTGKWFGPKGCKVTYKRFDIKAGGEVRYGIQWDGNAMHGRWRYEEVIPQKKLISIVSFTDESGDNIVSHFANPGWPKEVHSTVTFTPQCNKTEVLVEWRAHNPSAVEAKTFADGAKGMKGGWNGSFDVLEEFLGKCTANAAITPYLLFSGRCEEAIGFYESVLDAKVEMLMKHSESPAPPPPGMLQAGFERKIMHSSFVIRGTRIMASDGCDDKTPISGVSLSLALTASEIDDIFAKLAESGSVRMPLAQTFFSPRFGMLTDKFGMHWMLIVPPELA